MRPSSLLAAGFAAAVFFSSCSNSNGENNAAGTPGPADSARTGTNADSTVGNAAPTSSPEQSFINDAVTANTTELAWINAALKQSSSTAIKTMAMKMKADHEKLGSQVQDWLSNHLTVTAPRVDTIGVVDQTTGGKAWDTVWVAKMKTDHQATLDKLNEGKRTVTDTGLLRIINGAIPVVEAHVKMLQGMK